MPTKFKKVSPEVAIARRRFAVRQWLKQQPELTVMYWGDALPCAWWELLEGYIEGETDEDLEVYESLKSVDPDCPFCKVYMYGDVLEHWEPQKDGDRNAD